VGYLKPGSTVFLKAPDLIVKDRLQPRFIGPYKVHTVSRKGNYWLLNQNNELLTHSYPMNKLKIVERSQEDPKQVESILEMKQENNKRKFLVKYNSSKFKNEWLNEEDFVNVQMIEDFLKTTSSESDAISDANEENIDTNQTEISKELREQLKERFKIETSSIFSNKNSISVGLLTNLEHDFKSKTEIEFNNKFPEIKALLLQQQPSLNKCVPIKDYSRFILYSYAVNKSNEEISIENLKLSLISMFDKCKELKVKRLALSKSNLLSSSYDWKQVTSVLNECCADGSIKVTVHDYKPIQRTNQSVRAMIQTRQCEKMNMTCIDEQC
jgi:hypothetical protein